MIDREKLTKLLAMTASPNDGEALNAVRAANALVHGAGKTWEQVLAAPPQRPVTVTVTRTGFQQPEAVDLADWTAPRPKRV